MELLGLRGNGCPKDSATAQISPDYTSVSVLFSKMYAEIAAASQVQNKKLTCQMQLLFYFGGNYRLAITGTDIRGFVSIPAEGNVKLTAQHASPYSLNPIYMKRMTIQSEIQGPREEALLIQSDFSDIPIWSFCGTQGGEQGMNLMNVWVTIDATNKSKTADLYAGIDSIDFNGNPLLHYNLAWKYDKNCPRR